jgi:hypothetical protein
MRIHANSGLLFLNNKQLKLAKNKFEDSLKFAKQNKLDECSFEGELKEDYEDIIDTCKFNIKRIKAQFLMDEAEVNLKDGIHGTDDINMYLVNLALDQYKNAYKIISRDSSDTNITKNSIEVSFLGTKFNLYNDLMNGLMSNKETLTDDYDESEEVIFNKDNGNLYIDIEYEAICLANIIKIKYEILKNKSNLEKLLNDANKSIQLGESLSPKNVSNEQWFLDIKNIKYNIQMEIDSMNQKEENE